MQGHCLSQLGEGDGVGLWGDVRCRGAEDGVPQDSESHTVVAGLICVERLKVLIRPGLEFFAELGSVTTAVHRFD